MNKSKNVSKHLPRITIELCSCNEIKEGKNNFTQQLTWKSNEMAKITTILNKEDGNQELLKEVVYTWKF